MRVGLHIPDTPSPSSGAAKSPPSQAGQTSLPHSVPAQQSASLQRASSGPATPHLPPGTAANHPSLSAYVSAQRARSRMEQGTRTSAPGLDKFREALSELGFKLPSGMGATKVGKQAEQASLAPSAPADPPLSSDATSPRARFGTGPTVPPATQGLPAFRQALLEFKFQVPAGRDETKAWERRAGKNPGPGLVDMFRGDAKLRSVFRSKLALEKGDDASNAAIANAEAKGEMSALFENHALTSTKSPFVSVTSSQAAAEEKARGPSGTQAGWVTKFRLPEDLPRPNFENADTGEREHLVATKIDGKFIHGQYPVKPDAPPKPK
jgi:hypothetical protein